MGLLCLHIYIEKSGDLARCDRSLTHSLTHRQQNIVLISQLKFKVKADPISLTLILTLALAPFPIPICLQVFPLAVFSFFYSIFAHVICNKYIRSAIISPARKLPLPRLNATDCKEVARQHGSGAAQWWSSIVVEQYGGQTAQSAPGLWVSFHPCVQQQ